MTAAANVGGWLLYIRSKTPRVIQSYDQANLTGNARDTKGLSLSPLPIRKENEMEKDKIIRNLEKKAEKCLLLAHLSIPDSEDHKHFITLYTVYLCLIAELA